ncbi:SEL1-like repeat protein [Diaphorobacter sp. HDW4A]|uniref:SEL1-like repeat protein n=1 Tax=Diaphorobacter sp. HDW4A TaxID=2714924 RepID=UPI00140C3823|nr:SEL1-like repeat protein [Diaphorobacter sp. HDW4A]QIL82586.1 SEL1-like repeat protein [Diaphorobacter sp. HDW4A]
MSPVQAQNLPHPRTLLGAARMTLEQLEGTQGQHLKAYAACRLGYHVEARDLWERLAFDDDADALFELGRMAELGLGEPCDARRACTLYQRAAQLGHNAAKSRLS